ncbi:MAG TPA: hypothetical protein VLA03_04295, partial [Draconibacterium sp.]|nr:hypothetical protein [Draconibacterium sp.]
MVRKYKITGLIILLMFGFISGWSQNLDVPREKIVTHLSQQCLFPGEHLWLTVYVSNYSDLPGKQISNLAFVEFVDSRNTSLIRKKIMLKNGVGICAFSIPDSLSTGICQVMVYTNWLKNFGESSYSKTKVMVFNPNSPVNEESLTSKIPSIKAKETSNTGFGIQTNKTEYSTREKVILKFDFDTLQFKSANLSISARQKEPLQMRDITRREVDLPDFEIQNINHYPDYKGILLSGKILNKINNLPVQDEEIILSFPGEFVEIKYAHSNQNGEFSFLLEPNAGELDLVFNLPSDEHMVKLDEPFVNGFVQIPGQLDLKFTDATIQYLKDRFIKYQLSRRFGYANVENIVIEEKIRQTDFFGEAYQRVVFKDYKKLDSISEYFYELIPTVHFSIRQGEQQLYITNPETNFKLGDNPAVFIDGVYYPGLKELAALDYNLVKEISVVPKVYYYR